MVAIAMALASFAGPAPELIHQVPPSYPRTFGAAAWGEVSCVVEVGVEPDGTLGWAKLPDCPIDFELAVRSVLSAWRWRAYRLAEGDPLREARYTLVFPDPGRRVPPYRDFLLGVGPAFGQEHRSAHLRLRLVATANDKPVSTAVGLEVLQGGLGLPQGQGIVWWGASFGGERRRAALLAGLARGHQGRLIGGSSEWQLPLELAGQADAGPLRLHARARAWLRLRQRGPAFDSVVPGGGGGEVALGLTWTIPSRFDPQFGPRIEVLGREAFGASLVAVVAGLGL